MAKEADRLFRDNEVFEITIRAPFEKIKKQNKKSLKFAGTLSYLERDGRDQNLNIKVEVRGNNRLKKSVCKFPPLKIRFNKKSNKKTLFAKQKSLKLVTQCDPYKTQYAGYLMKEYLAYRIFNLITDQSYRVRLVKVNYQGESSLISNFAFFIENNKRLAKRLGTELLSVEETSAVSLDQNHLNKVSLFQLLVGNVDYSVTSGGRGECCHNVKLFKPGDAEIFAIPYDFDFSGLVKAKYAVPAAQLRLDSITERRYRGYCRNNNFLAGNISRFNIVKPEIISMVEEFEYLGAGQKKSALRYIRSFYKIIDEPKRVERAILKFCHKSQFVEVRKN